MKRNPVPAKKIFLGMFMLFIIVLVIANIHSTYEQCNDGFYIAGHEELGIQYPADCMIKPENGASTRSLIFPIAISIIIILVSLILGLSKQRGRRK